MAAFKELSGEQILKEATPKTQEGNHPEYEEKQALQGFKESIFEWLESSDRALKPMTEVLKIENEDEMERIFCLFRDGV